jgi:DNA (cytosine-5)-methyltransferase 1
VDNTKELTHLSLCSGYEGIGRGLRAVFPTLREIAYVEIETYCIANLVKEMETGVLDTAPIYSDLKTFPFKEFRGKVDILSGGFPCQPFSNAGVRRGTEDPRHLFPYIRDGIRECQPRICFLENVEGIISAKTAEGESVLQYVLRELEGLGYCAEAGIFSASEVGAPHQRKRVFILGYAKHDGHSTAKELRSCGETSDDQSEGQDRSIKLEGAGGRSIGASIQGLDETISESKESRRCDQSRGEKLGNAKSEGSQGWLQTREYDPQGWQEQDGCPAPDGRIRSIKPSSYRFPSRPGERQKEWEAPRVTGTFKGRVAEIKRKAKFRLGGAANGSSHRIDRLRLLGNGVVPQVATKAFVTLFSRLYE